jgi:hypothetical protein
MSEHDAAKYLEATARLRTPAAALEDTQRMPVIERRERAKQGRLMAWLECDHAEADWRLCQRCNPNSDL